MAMDEALLDFAIEHDFPEPIVRIYGWAGPTLSIGRHQRLSEEASTRCQVFGVEVVRRPTGGAAVLHGSDVTYSVTGRSEGRSVLDAYRWVAQGLVAGLRHLGLYATVAEHDATSTASPACFASTRGADLEVSGSKICGSAQLRRRGWLLQHGSIPLQDPWSLTQALLGEAAPSTARPACLDSLRPGTEFEEVAGGLIEGFTSVWGPCRRLPGAVAEICAVPPVEIMLA
jgi:lipoate-protein ligase A